MRSKLNVLPAIALGASMLLGCADRVSEADPKPVSLSNCPVQTSVTTAKLVEDSSGVLVVEEGVSARFVDSLIDSIRKSLADADVSIQIEGDIVEGFQTNVFDDRVGVWSMRDYPHKDGGVVLSSRHRNWSADRGESPYAIEMGLCEILQDDDWASVILPADSVEAKELVALMEGVRQKVAVR